MLEYIRCIQACKQLVRVSDFFLEVLVRPGYEARL